MMSVGHQLGDINATRLPGKYRKDGKKGRNTYETPGYKSGGYRSAVGAASLLR
jgi:hypothetical protein